MFADPAATAEEEERTRRRDRASGSRQAAYELLKLGDQEREALEWACRKRLNSNFAGLRPFFEEAEALHGDDQLAAWLNGPMFQGGSGDQLKAAAASALGHYEKWQRSVLTAERLEKGVIWFMWLMTAGFVVAVIYGLITR